jgi:membrane protein involved in colicin uptake
VTAEAEAAKAQAAIDAKKAKALATADAKLAKKATADAGKAAAEKARADEKAAKKTAAEANKASKLAEKEANRQPEQNGVRRPGPDGLCGQVWTLADTLSAALNAPVAIGALMEAATAKSLNPANVRTEYARWKKFHGLTGRIAAPAPVATTA